LFACAMLLAGPFCFAPLADSDTGWHVAVGRLVLGGTLQHSNAPRPHVASWALLAAVLALAPRDTRWRGPVRRAGGGGREPACRRGVRRLRPRAPRPGGLLEDPPPRRAGHRRLCVAGAARESRRALQRPLPLGTLDLRQRRDPAEGVRAAVAVDAPGLLRPLARRPRPRGPQAARASL